MQKHYSMLAVAFTVMLAVFVCPVTYAADDEVTALKDEIKALNEKIAELERRTRSVEGRVAAPGAPIVPPGEEAGGLLRTVEDIQMSGFVETQWNNNFQQPRGTVAGATGGGAGTNNLRVFDTDDGSFTVNAVQLEFQKNANPEGGAGFRVDIAMGEDMEVVDGATFGSDLDEFGIQQAYVEANTPLKFWEGNSILPDTVNWRAGRYVTLAGAEVIEQKDNWNISRSFAFGFAIPFTHTGVRTNFKLFDDYLDVYVGLNNGWDNVVDNNADKTWEYGLGWSPIEKVSLFHSIYWGPEVRDASGHRRFLTSNVIKWETTDKLTLMYNFDWGNQRRVASSATTDDRDNAQWYSNVAYARYQLTDKLAMAYRFELFVDQDVFRTVAAPRLGSDRTWAQTWTAEYQLYDNLISRLEYRMDHSNDDKPFITEGAQGLSGGENNQHTIGASLIYIFA